MMEFEKNINLLALTHAIEKGQSINEWCPFAKGDMLWEIIKSYNDRCMQSYWEQWEDSIFIKTYGEGISVKLYSLSTLDNIPDREYFDNISIILIDLDAIGEEELERIKKYFKGKTFVAQVSRTRSTRLITMGAPFFNASTEVMVDRETLVNCLICKFCEPYRVTIEEGTTYPSKIPSLRSKDAQATTKAFLEALPGVAAKVRDAAIIRGISKEETVTLAHQVVMQEFALNRIEVQVRSQTNFNRVLLDPIRKPLFEMAIELGFQSPALREVNLVEFQVTKPIYEMTIEQRNIMRGFGIKEEVEPFAVVVPDQPTVRDSVERLKGVAKTREFSAELPVGLGGIRGNL